MEALRPAAGEQPAQQGVVYGAVGASQHLGYHQKQELLPALEEDANVLLSLGHALARSCCTEHVLQPIASTIQMLFPSSSYLSVEVPVLPQVLLSIQNLVQPGSCSLYFLHERNTLAGSCYKRRSCVSARQPRGGRAHSHLDIDMGANIWDTELHACFPIPHVTQQSLMLLVGAAKSGEADPLTRADTLLTAYMEMCAAVPCIGVLSIGMARGRSAGMRELANLALLASAVSTYLAADWQTFLDIATNSMTRHSLRVHTGPVHAHNKLLGGNDHAAGPLMKAVLARAAAANPAGAPAGNGGALGGPVGSSDYTNAQGSDSLESCTDEDDTCMDDTYESGYDSEYDDSMATDAGFDGKHNYSNTYGDDGDSSLTQRERSASVLPQQRGTVLPAAGEASGETEGNGDVLMGDAPSQGEDALQGGGRSGETVGASCAADVGLDSFRGPYRDDDPGSSGGGSGSGPSGGSSSEGPFSGGQGSSGAAYSSTSGGSSHMAGHKQHSSDAPSDPTAQHPSSTPTAALDNDATYVAACTAGSSSTPNADVGVGPSAAACVPSGSEGASAAAHAASTARHSDLLDSAPLDAFYSSGDEPSCKGSKEAVAASEGVVQLVPAAEPPALLHRLGGFITSYADRDLEMRFRAFFAQQYRMNDVLSIVVQMLPLVFLMMCNMAWSLAVALANVALFVVLPGINRPWYERHRDAVCSIRALLHIMCSQTCVGAALAATTSGGAALVDPGSAALLIITSGATSLLYFGLLPMRPGPLIGVGVVQLAVTLNALPQTCGGALTTAAGGLCAAKVLAVLALAGAAPAAIICVTCERYMRSVFSQRVAADGTRGWRPTGTEAATPVAMPTRAAPVGGVVVDAAAQ